MSFSANIGETEINVIDIFDELRDQNNSLKSELDLSENCVKILLKIKDYYEKRLIDCKCLTNDENKTELNEFESELENALNRKSVSKDNTNAVIVEKKEVKPLVDNKEHKHSKPLVPKPVVKVMAKPKFKTKIRPKLKSRTKVKVQFVCDNCGKSFIYAKALNSHKTRFHSETHDSKESLNKIFNNKISYECTEKDCQFRTYSKQIIKDHRNVHSNLTPYQCDVTGCAKLFKFLNSLQNHKRYVHSAQSHTCSWVGCEFQTKFKHRLQVHQMTHLGQKLWRCDWPGCDFQTLYSNKLKHHKFRHTGEKPYSCSWPACEWSFRERGHLSTHMLKHTGLKPWKCEQCGQQFQTKQAMRQHVDRRHRQQLDP